MVNFSKSVNLTKIGKFADVTNMHQNFTPFLVPTIGKFTAVNLTISCKSIKIQKTLILNRDREKERAIEAECERG